MHKIPGSISIRRVAAVAAMTSQLALWLVASPTRLHFIPPGRGGRRKGKPACLCGSSLHPPGSISFRQVAARRFAQKAAARHCGGSRVFSFLFRNVIQRLWVGFIVNNDFRILFFSHFVYSSIIELFIYALAFYVIFFTRCITE